MAATKERKRHWLKAFVSIAVTLVAMPLTHILARALKDGTAGVEQFYAGMGMGLFGLLMVIIGVFIKGDVKQTLLGLFGGMFYWMGAIDFLFMYYANRFGTQAQLDPVTGEIVSPAGIPDTSVHIRVLGHDDDAVPVLHRQRLQFPELVAALVLRQAQEGNRRTPHDTPYWHCRLYGSHYHAVDVLLGADVLLR